MNLVEFVAPLTNKISFNQLIGTPFLKEKTFQDFTLSSTFQKAKKLHAQGLQEDRFGYKSRKAGIFGESSKKDVKAISDFLKLKKSQGARVLIHTGIGGQALGNRAQIEPVGEAEGFRVYVLEKLGIDFKSLFEEIEVQGYQPSQILIHASSKSGTTDETMINFQGALKFLIRGLASEWKMDSQIAKSLIQKYEGVSDLSKSSLVSLNLTSEEKKLLQLAFDRVVFTTTINISKSRIYALAKSNFVKELSQEVHGQSRELTTFAIPDNVGGRFSRRCQSGLISAGFSGRDISQIQSGSEQVLSFFESDDPQVNPALKLAIAIYLLEYDFISFSVQNSSLIAVADAFRQLFPESNGKDGQGPFVVSSIGQKELNDRAQASFQTIFFILNIEKDQKGQSIVPLSLKDASKPVFIYSQNSLSEVEEAQRDLFFDDFTVWYGLLKAAEITDHIKSPEYQKRDPQNQPFVEHGKKLMEKAAGELNRSEDALNKRYQSEWQKVEKGPTLSSIASFENKKHVNNQKFKNDLQSLIDQEIEPSLKKLKRKSSLRGDELLKILEEIESKKKNRLSLKTFNEKRTLDDEIGNLFGQIISIGFEKQTDSIEKEAKQLAALILYALKYKKIILPVFYSADVQAETLGEWWRRMTGSLLSDYGLGTREQHSHFQSLLDGKDVVWPLLVDMVSPLSEIIQREEPVCAYGLAKDYLDGLYPDEVRRLYLEAEEKTFFEIACRSVAVLKMKGLSSKEAKLEAYRYLGRALVLVQACTEV